MKAAGREIGGFSLTAFGIAGLGVAATGPGGMRLAA